MVNRSARWRKRPEQLAYCYVCRVAQCNPLLFSLQWVRKFDSQHGTESATRRVHLSTGGARKHPLLLKVAVSNSLTCRDSARLRNPARHVHCCVRILKFDQNLFSTRWNQRNRYSGLVKKSIATVVRSNCGTRASQRSNSVCAGIRPNRSRYSPPMYPALVLP